jgi:vitamin B12/bleomycin/antimicrobial peptide transport system ATP-binding/permease protein
MNENLLPECSQASDTASDRFDRLFWHRLWRLARPYWNSPRRKKALLLLAAMVALNLGVTGMQAIFSYLNRDIFNALQAKNSGHFYHVLMQYGIMIVLFVPIAAFYPYITGLLSIDWRDWLTETFVGRMLSRNALYYIMRDHAVDNPDQRISEDINTFTTGALNYSMSVLQSVVTAATFFGILWAISHGLALCLVGYALIGTWLAAVIGRRLVLINFNQQRFEADYRFALVHARDNAEAIALYDGARDEARQLSRRFANVIANFKLLILWQRHLGLFTAAYDNAAALVPWLVLAGAYFSGRFQLGEITQAGYAFSVLQGALSLIVDQFQGITDYASVVNRLAAFEEHCELADRTAMEGDPHIELVETNGAIAVENVTLMTPDGTRVLQQGLTLAVKDGDSILLIGPSGAGKTSLMRAVAGLWSFGHGRIERPSSAQIMFLPQKPYFILGSLRHQIQYPRAGSVDDEALLEVLQVVGLAHLPQQFGGLDAELNWADVLSGGEQQRLAFARLLINRPRFAFLDEATSALDLAAEASLYAMLADSPSAFISIGHRPSLRGFHKQTIELPLLPAIGVCDSHSEPRASGVSSS